MYHLVIGDVQLGVIPFGEIVKGLGLPVLAEKGDQLTEEMSRAAQSNLTAILPLLTALSQTGEKNDKGETKPTRYLLAKGLPILSSKLVERAWSSDYVDMEEFLPALRLLHVVEQEKSTTLQDSLVGALSQFQAIQQQQQTQHSGMDILAWTKCFTLYLTVVAKKWPEMIPSMVAHLHTVLKLSQKVARSRAWYEYNVHFRMEMAASEDRGVIMWGLLAILSLPACQVQVSHKIPLT